MASHIVVLGFELEYGAEGMLNDIQKWHEEGLVELEDAAIATSTPDGTIQIKQTHKKDDQFALKGGGVGLLAGLLLCGPVLGLIAGACSGRKRTSVLENVLGHIMSATITVLNSYQDRQTVISPYPKNLE